MQSRRSNVVNAKQIFSANRRPRKEAPSGGAPNMLFITLLRSKWYKLVSHDLMLSVFQVYRHLPGRKPDAYRRIS